MSLIHELYELDILDGSPPCSSFSMAGNREKDWGKAKKFAEGQKKQVLDTLFFDFIALAKRLQPKVVIAENVKGILQGNAIEYVKRIYEDFDQAGYYVQDFTLNAQDMGVPQRRERVFFLALRKDLAEQFLSDSFLEPYINMTFAEEPIPFGAIADYQGKPLSKSSMKYWQERRYGDIHFADASIRVFGKNSRFNMVYVYEDKPCPTILVNKGAINTILFSRPQHLSDTEIIKASTFPLDYDFLGRRPIYVCGMSVPPIMMKQIAERVYEYWAK